jgi:hypothetical protein
MMKSLLMHITYPMLLVCCLLSGCGHARLQSFDEATAQIMSANQQQNHNACLLKNSDIDRNECLRRTDEVYSASRAERARNRH